MRYQSEPLTDLHELDQFSSSNAELDDWLIRHARHAAAMNNGRTLNPISPNSRAEHIEHHHSIPTTSRGSVQVVG